MQLISVAAVLVQVQGGEEVTAAHVAEARELFLDVKKAQEIVQA